jgi:hypothetical protein
LVPGAVAGVVVVVVVVVVVAAGVGAGAAGAALADGVVSGGGVRRPEGGLVGVIAFWASAPGVWTASSAIANEAVASKARQVRKRFILMREA